MRLIVIAYLSFNIISISHAQSDDWKGHIQISFNLGSPITNVGLRFIGEFQRYSGVEVAAGYGLTYHFKNYGLPGQHLEHSVFMTGHYLWGDREGEEGMENFIKHIDSGRSLNSLGYTYERFLNPIGTSQATGTILYRYDNLAFQFENDFFGHMNYWDEYRTGGIGIGYVDKENYYTMKALFWTGSSHDGEEKKYREGKSNYPARWGYRDIMNCIGGKYSHGIVSFGVIRDAGYGQNVGGFLGIDAEQIRNVVQNKFFHDMYFLPNFVDNPKNLHLPMKMENGENYLYKEDQKIRAPRLVWQLSLNPELLY